MGTEREHEDKHPTGGQFSEWLLISLDNLWWGGEQEAEGESVRGQGEAEDQEGIDIASLLRHNIIMASEDESQLPQPAPPEKLLQDQDYDEPPPSTIW